MTSTWLQIAVGVATTCLAGCGSAVSAGGGRTGDASLDSSSREGGSDGSEVVDAGSERDVEPMSDACTAIEIEAGKFDSGSSDAGMMTGCQPDPCGSAQFCVAWVKGPGSNGQPYGQCVDIPADIPQCALTTCSPTPTCDCAKASTGVGFCVPKSCEQDGGQVILTCYIPAPP
jgi:hypothetical protein